MSILQKSRTHKGVSISNIRHRGRSVVLVQFSYNKTLYRRCKELSGRYTRTYKGWWWSAREITEDELRRKLGISSKSDGTKGGRKTISRVQIDLPPETEHKIREMERWMEQKRYSGNAIKTYLSFVKQFFVSHPGLSWDGMTKGTITRHNYDQFIAKNKSYSTQNQWINAIKMYLKVHGLDAGELADIERPRKKKTLPDVLTTEEIKSIFQHTNNLKHRTLLMLIYSCGLRIGETLALRPTDIHTDEGLIYIRGGKGKKDRRVPLSDQILGQLRRYYRTYHPRNHLFEGQRGGKYSNRSAAQVLRRAVKKAGIEKRVTLHTLRHSYATHLTNRGVNIQYLQEILGHSSPKTTMLYTHLSGRDIKNIKSPLDDMEI